MKTLEPILAEHPFLKGIQPQYLQRLVGCATNVRFDTGQFVFQDDDPANHFYLLREGKVAIEVPVPGRGQVTIQTLGPGEVLGWSWLIPPYRWRFDARALEVTRAIALDGKCLRGKFEKDNGLGYELLKRFAPIIAQRVEATRIQLLDVYGVCS
ncbi:MAG: cyclic nucleotide-binding domain-containing protein [Candidatus Omnitrophica bacterium]|nr:cyclic nucleotide-binding domain-containing protein [Candidatus Omnitrophota bacterium]